MTFILEPETGIAVSSDIKDIDLAERAAAAFETALQLEEHGADLTPNAEDKDVAAKLALAYADNPEKTSRKATNKRMSSLTPASLVLTNGILQEFGQSVVESAIQVRHLVTNKLLLETENSDARIRIRALELLGKISDVGLFAEKSEITITHQSTDDLRAKLRGKLEKLVNPPDYDEKDVVFDGEAIDIDAELGLTDEKEERS
jgi:hypothetical protein